MNQNVFNSPSGAASDPLTGLMNTIVDGVITIDAQGRILAFNAACETLFGYRSTDILGQNVKLLMAEAYQGEHDSYLATYLSTGRPKIIGAGHEVTGRRRDGTTFPMELSVGEIGAGDQRVFVGVVRDITDRRRLEQGLRDSEAQHRAVIETAVDGIIIIDELGTVRIYNPACEAMFGFSADEVVGRNVRMLMPSPFYDEHDEYLRNYSRSGVRKVIGIGREVIGRRKDGSTFPMELSVGETSMAGGRLFVGVLRDNSGKKLAEEALRRSQAELQERVRELEIARDQMEQQSAQLAALAGQASAAQQVADIASKAKSDFLAMMSHEIRTPMNAIMGFAELLQRSGLDEPMRGYAAMIKQSGASLMNILDGVLDLSKIESGRMSLDIEEFLLADEIDSIEALWSARARQKGLLLRTEISPLIPASLKGDATRLRQVLSNLVSNAIKFTASGEIGVKASLAGLADERVTLRFEVSDTGVGISREAQYRIFEPFMQAAPSVSREYGGTGLGLSICRRLVWLMGGDIGVESAPGQGSTFWFTADLEIADTAGAAARREGDASDDIRARLFILVAEDHPQNQALMRAILESAGHRVHMVSSGREAINAIATGDFDLAILDINMPEMDGLETLRHLREFDGPRALMPVIALTASAMTGDRERFIEAGFSDYVSKPVSIAELFRVIEGLAAEGKTASSLGHGRTGDSAA